MSNARLSGFRGILLLLLIVPAGSQAGATPDSCLDDTVLQHVLSEFRHYGPRSRESEYFGFIYRKDGLVSSVVTAGDSCASQTDCAVNPIFALRRLPAGAQVIGEWHTHPGAGTDAMSVDDVHGAHANVRMRCYSVFYSGPGGQIYRWDPRETTVPGAMASRVSIGNYRRL